MAEEVVLPNKSIAAYNPQKNNEANAPFAVKGIVKDNVDATRTGTLRVYIEQFGSTPDDDKSWTTVHYISPFYGRTEPTAPSTGYGSFTGNPHSYGFWATAPDIGTEVLCIFESGKRDFGFYLGSIVQPFQNFMVPAVAASKEVIASGEEAKSYGGATSLPVTEINTNNKGDDNKPTANKIAKPIHSYQAGILFQQGLLRDSIRGTISSSSTRETPSRVFGFSTPGRPIYKGGFTDESIAATVNKDEPGKQIIARRGGHSIVMDDGSLTGENQLIRIRTALGHQITMSDDGQTLFIIHSNGQSYIELGKEGTVDIFSTNSFNVRTQGDINLHADNNVNINAKKNLNISADTINLESTNNTNHKVGGAYGLSAKGKVSMLSSGSMAMTSSGTMSVKSSSTTFINGSKVNLNTGAGEEASDVPSMQKTKQIDTLFDKEKGWIAAPGALETITSRTPAHTPWANANQGVDVKTSGDAADNLPKPATNDSTVAAVGAAGGLPKNPVDLSAVATVKSASGLGGAIDAASTAAAISQTAATAMTGAAASAVQAGAGIIPDGIGGVTAAVGKLAMTPTQLADAGIIKPGSEALVQKALNSGKSLAEAIPKQLFTGKDGATDLTSFVKNTTAQIGAQTNLMSKGLEGLKSAGLITGKESPTAIMGLVSASATAGVSSVVDFAKNAAGNVSNLLSGSGGSPIAGVKDLIAGGNFAGKLADQAMSGLGSLTGSIGKSLTGMQDMVTGAFNSIKKSLPSLPVGQPVNLAEKAAEAAAGAEGAPDTAKPDSSLFGSLSNAATGAFNSVASAAGSLGSTLNKAISSGTSAIDNLQSGTAGAIPGVGSNLVKSALGSVTGVVNKAQTAVASVASGISNITGSSSAVGNMVNKGLSAVNSVPGINNLTNGSSISGQINSALGTITGGLSKITQNPASAANGLLALASSGLGGQQLAKLSSMVNSLGGGAPTGFKAPTVALNTMNRGSINSSLNGLLGSGVPQPNFSGTVKQPNAAKEQQLSSLQQELANIQQQIKENDQAYDAEYAELLNIKSTISSVSDEEYQAQGLGPKFKEQKAKCGALLNKKLDLLSEKNQLEDKIIEAQYGSTSSLLAASLLSRRG